jgi:hypothetical protein
MTSGFAYVLVKLLHEWPARIICFGSACEIALRSIYMTGKGTIIKKGSPSPGRVSKGYIGNGQVGWNHNSRFRNACLIPTVMLRTALTVGAVEACALQRSYPRTWGVLSPSGSLGGANRVANIGSNGLGGRGGASQLPAHRLAGRGGASQLPNSGGQPASRGPAGFCRLG